MRPQSPCLNQWTSVAEEMQSRVKADGESASPYQNQGERYGHDIIFDVHEDRCLSTQFSRRDMSVVYLTIYEYLWQTS